MKRATYAILAMCLLGAPAFAADGRGTADEAKALVQKAVAFIKANGPDKAYSTFTAKDPQFINQDLYVSVIDMKGMMLAHGANPKLVGVDNSEMQDTDGKLYMKERLQIAKTQQSFWTDYKFANPVSKKVEPKSTYCEVLNATMVCCGFYK